MFAVEDGMVIVKVLAATKEHRRLRKGLIRFGRRWACCVIWRREEKPRERGHHGDLTRLILRTRSAGR
jgi:hypothetical protein